MVVNLNASLPIKNYADIIAGVRGYYSGSKYCVQAMYHYSGENQSEINEINNEFERIGNKVNTLDKLMEFTDGEESNYWSQTENFYYWARFNPAVRRDDYCVYIKTYRK